MKLQIDNLGKVAVTVEKGYWNINKDYDKLTIVQIESEFATYISRKPVPSGIDLSDRDYWIPFSSLKEDIVLDYNFFVAKYGEELANIKNNIKDIDIFLKEINKKLDEFGLRNKFNIGNNVNLGDNVNIGKDIIISVNNKGYILNLNSSKSSRSLVDNSSIIGYNTNIGGDVNIKDKVKIDKGVTITNNKDDFKGGSIDIFAPAIENADLPSGVTNDTVDRTIKLGTGLIDLNNGRISISKLGVTLAGKDGGKITNSFTANGKILINGTKDDKLTIVNLNGGKPIIGNDAVIGDNSNIDANITIINNNNIKTMSLLPEPDDETNDEPEQEVDLTTTIILNGGSASLGKDSIIADGAFIGTNVYISTSDIENWNNKVDKVVGKGLSSNDFTTAYKDKLDAIEDNANKYTLPVASSNILGGVKIGNNLTIANGILSGKDSYTKSETNTELAKKVDKVNGKGLSTEDFTTTLLNKLNGLSNYNDAEVKSAIESIQEQINTLVGSEEAEGAIDTFREIVKFLEDINADSDSLDSILDNIRGLIQKAQDDATYALNNTQTNGDAITTVSNSLDNTNLVINTELRPYIQTLDTTVDTHTAKITSIETSLNSTNALANNAYNAATSAVDSVNETNALVLGTISDKISTLEDNIGGAAISASTDKTIQVRLLEKVDEEDSTRSFYIGDQAVIKKGVNIGENVTANWDTKDYDHKKLVFDNPSFADYSEDYISISQGVKIDDYIHIENTTPMGDVCILGSLISKPITLGGGVNLGKGVEISKGIEIYNYTTSGDGTVELILDNAGCINIGGLKFTDYEDDKLRISGNNGGIELNGECRISLTGSLHNKKSITIDPDLDNLTPIQIGGNTTIENDVYIGQHVVLTKTNGGSLKIGTNNASYIDQGVNILYDTYIGNNVVIGTDIKPDSYKVFIDENVSIGNGVDISDGIKIKSKKINNFDYFEITNYQQSSFSIGEGVTIGTDVNIGNNVNIPNNFKVVYKTAAEYAALTTKDNNTLYFIVE